jgi:hypothetical protein
MDKMSNYGLLKVSADLKVGCPPKIVCDPKNKNKIEKKNLKKLFKKLLGCWRGT